MRIIKTAGFTLIEVVVTIAIIGVALVGYATALRTITLSRQIQHQTLALHLASKKLEEFKITPFDSLPLSGYIDDPALLSLPGATSDFLISDYHSPQVKKAMVTVKWQEATGQKSVELTSLLIANGL